MYNWPQHIKFQGRFGRCRIPIMTRAVLDVAVGHFSCMMGRFGQRNGPFWTMFLEIKIFGAVFARDYVNCAAGSSRHSAVASGAGWRQRLCSCERSMRAGSARCSSTGTQCDTSLTRTNTEQLTYVAVLN